MIIFKKIICLNKILICFLLFILAKLIINSADPKNIPKNYVKIKNEKEKFEFLNHSEPIINNYKLYNISENPFLSIILDFSYLNQINDTFINFLGTLSIQRKEDIEIVFLYKSLNNILWNNSIQSFLKNKNIKAFYFNTKHWAKKFFDLLNLIKGKFLILINRIIKIENNDFYKVCNITKGNISNIFTLKSNNETFKLIRTKILRDIGDIEKKFENFNDIINYINTLPSPIINKIPIAFCLDNFYTYLTYTSMISILATKDYYTYISFYLIIPLNFSKENTVLIESLYEQFDYFNITFIKMDNRYENSFINRYITHHAYYRMSLGELLPNLNKIIYLDSDTICLKDLSNLYNLNFKGKIFIGRIITYNNKHHSFKINSGVLLINLFRMRKLKIEKRVITLLNNGFHDSFHDQAIINNYFKKYIGFLPPEFNSIIFNYESVKKRYKKFGGLYNFDSLYFSFKFPYIIHYHGAPKNKTFDKEDWYYFARKSKYFKRRSYNYSEIFKYIKKEI